MLLDAVGERGKLSALRVRVVNEENDYLASIFMLCYAVVANLDSKSYFSAYLHVHTGDLTQGIDNLAFLSAIVFSLNEFIFNIFNSPEIRYF